MRTTVVGSYPKVTDSKADNLSGVIDRWQKQLLADADLEGELQKVIRRVIREQEEAGIDLVTDGQIRWEDLIHPIARSSQGIKRGTLRRFFDNNVYYRRLEVDGQIGWQKSSVSEEFIFAAQAAAKPVKVALPGPLTLVLATEAKPGQTPESLLSLYAGLLRKEVEALAEAGAKEIQLDEPALAAGNPLNLKAVEAINQIFQVKQGGIRRWVASYFQDTASILPTLAKLQVEVLVLDLVSAREKVADLIPKVARQLKEGIWRGEVALGLLDARNTKLESPQELTAQIAEFTKVVPAERLWLSPNCGLEFLPHEAVLKKLTLLHKVARGV